MGAFFLLIPYGMHLVVSTQFYFFWVICHLSKTLPQKDLEQEPQNRFFPSPHRQTMPFYLWLMTSPCPVLTGYRLVMFGSRLVMFGSCACFSFMYVQNLSTAHAFVVVGLHSLPSIFWLFSGSPFFYVLPHLGPGPCLTMSFAFLQLPFFLLLSPAIPLYHSCCEIVCPNPVGLLWACHLFFSQWSSTAIESFITSLTGSCVPFVFSWASLTHLLSLGLLGSFLNFAFPWAFIEFFGPPQLNYIIPHPWGLWTCHQPLNFFAFITLGLPWPIITFPHHILPMVCFFFFFLGLLKAHLPPNGH